MLPEHQSEKSASTRIIFRTLRSAYRYLAGRGYKLSYETFRTHTLTGKVARNVDGLFTAEVLEEYARQNLFSLSQDAVKKVADWQAVKLKADAENKRIMAARGQLKLDLEQGKLIERAKHEEDLAARMAFFKRELETFMLRRSGKVIELAQETDPTAAILTWWKDEVTNWLDTWSGERSYLVELDVAEIDPGVLGKGRGRAKGLTGPQLRTLRGGK
jgi:hypothetical protein